MTSYEAWVNPETGNVVFVYDNSLPTYVRFQENFNPDMAYQKHCQWDGNEFLETFKYIGKVTND